MIRDRTVPETGFKRGKPALAAGFGGRILSGMSARPEWNRLGGKTTDVQWFQIRKGEKGYVTDWYVDKRRRLPGIERGDAGRGKRHFFRKG
jgi:hypothetical protein